MSSASMRLFFAYHEKDAPHQKVLERQLEALVRQGVLSHYESAMMQEDWGWASDDSEIDADIVLFLVSPYFVAAQAAHKRQIQQVLSRCEGKQSLLMGVVLREGDYAATPYIAQLRFPRKEGQKEVTAVESSAWGSMEAAYREIAQKIEEAAAFVRKERQRDAAHFNNRPPVNVRTNIERNESGGFTKNISVSGDTGEGGLHLSQTFNSDVPFPLEPEAPRPKRKIVFLAANPSDTTQLQLPKEAKSIQDGLRQSNHREDFEFKTHFEVRVSDILNILLNESPEIVHFSGHGSGDKGLHFQNLMGTTQLVSTEALEALFKELQASIQCVLLNACYAEAQAEAIAQHIPYVIGMKDAISDTAAVFFATGFYNALASDKTFDEAFRLARVNILLQGLPQAQIPVLYQQGMLVRF